MACSSFLEKRYHSSLDIASLFTAQCSALSAKNLKAFHSIQHAPVHLTLSPEQLVHLRSPSIELCDLRIDVKHR